MGALDLLSKILGIAGLLVQLGGLLLLISPFFKAKALLRSSSHTRIDAGGVDGLAAGTDISDVLEVFLMEKSKPHLLVYLTISSAILQGASLLTA
jgi:hypothetical protein